MDLASALKTEIFRPVVLLVVPGLIASFPFFLIAWHWFPELVKYRDSHEVAYYSIAGLLVLAVGFILEDLGSRVETQLWSWLIKRDSRYADGNDIWNRYLALTIDKEPIAQGYLRTILLRTKFELSLVAALPIGLIGLIWYRDETGLFSRDHLYPILFWGTVVTIYMLHESYCGVKLLADIRKVIVSSSAMPEPPSCPWCS